MSITNKRLKDAIGIARVSSSSQLLNASIETQTEEIRIRAEKEGYNIVEVLVDGANSAYHKVVIKRQAMNELLEKTLSEDYNIEAIFFYEESRLSRQFYDFTLFVYDVIKRERPQVKFFSTFTPGEWDPYNLISVVNFATAAEQSVKLSRRMKDSHNTVLNKQERPGSSAPYGYKLRYSLSPEENRKLSRKEKGEQVIDVGPANIVSLIFYLASWGHSQRTIANLLNDCEIPSPEGKTWSSGTIDYILDNDHYLGHLPWNIRSSRNTSRKKQRGVTGMPNAKGEGYVDYVLRGTNGKILAVVEAKRTSREAKEGRNQAKLYADCIEQMQGLRPVIFYTNGFETHIWHDDYAARKVSGFYTQDELQLLIDRRKIKQHLANVDINDDITNRYYQKEAILAVCDTFSNNQRKGLLVMATGSGKTRTAISLVDVLTKQYWVKNVLFLADRTSLVKQAFRNFNTLLPNLSLSNMLEKNSNPEAARMVFSTYPTMMNAIDEVKRKDGNRLFTIGHFDLIIIDESHRSIYQKYKSIFDYFDGMLVGLTATPKDELDKNTYTIFDLENGVPTFAYELAKAVEDGYLVDYRTRETTLKILDDGIHYDDLSEAEKQEFDEIFEDEPQVKDIDSAAINNFVFNKNTIDHVLNDLMEHGLKVEGGDKLGKTIIFAKNHKHAMAIKERFDLKFPEYGGNFAEVIDYSVEYYQTLIDDFSDPAKMPQIAISVDMLDTGIDVPDVVNLVFFKKVRSKTKFWQMIGRGTRLRKDLFGPGMDKEYFLIFDYLRNFEYFRENEKGEETKISQTLTERLFNSKVDIVRELQSLQYQEEPFIGYREQLLKEILTDIRALNDENFRVRQYLQYVHKYQNVDNWQTLSVVQTNEVKENVSPLIMPIEDDELAKRFDLLMLTIELASVQSNNATKPIRRVVDTADALSKLGTIPQVLAQKDVIDDVRTTEFWKEASLADLEKVRVALRDLIRYIERSNQKIYYTDFQDEVMTVAENKSILNVNDLKSYRKKVEHYLKEHQHEDTLAIYKLRNNKPLTKQDVEYLEGILWNELGSKEQYEKDYGDTPVTKLVRKIVGLDKQAAVEAFSAFISEQQLTLQQTQFVELIIDYIVKNGTLERQALQQDPFSSTGGIMVVFKDQLPKARGILDIIDGINRNAEDIS